MRIHRSYLIGVAALLIVVLFAQPAFAQNRGKEATDIKGDIVASEARLNELRKDLSEQSKSFEEFSANAAKFEREAEALGETIEQLQRQEDPVAAETIDTLRIEQAGLLERAEQEKRKLAIVVEAMKIERSEMQLLEDRIALDELALGRLLGEIPTELPAEDSAPSEEEDKASEQPEAPAPTPMGQLTSIVAGGSAESVPAKPASRTSLSETAEQIQARQNAEKARREALHAEQRLLEFVSRKQALIEQISLEKQQLRVAEEAQQVLGDELAVINREVAVRSADGETGRQTGEEQERSALLVEMGKDLDSIIALRTKNLQDMQSRLAGLNELQPEVVAEVENSRKAAEKANEARIWAYSPANPANIMRWMRIRGPGILLVLSVMIVLLFVTRFFVGRFIRFLVRSAQPAGRSTRGQRAETVASTLGSVITAIVAVIAIIIVLQEAGIDIATLLGGAAILGVAVAFGAQNLMKDYFNGLMILLEDQYGLDDLVTIGAVEGRIERVTMRTTVVRDIEGRLHFIPNGQITLVTNRSYQWSTAMFDIPVPYNSDLDRVMDILMEVANELCADSEYSQSISGEPVMLGVNEYAESAIMIRFYIETAPAMQMPVRREMLRRIKQRFDKEAISIPYPHRVVVQADS